MKASMLASLATKLWLYGGWFYFSLFAALVIQAFVIKRRGWLAKLALVVTFLVSIFWLIAFSKDMPKWWHQINLPGEQKTASNTLNQEAFATILKQQLSNVSNVCLLFDRDMPTHFLVQRLYPIKLEILPDATSIADCEFIILQFEPYNLPGFQLAFEQDQNYLYKRL